MHQYLWAHFAADAPQHIIKATDLDRAHGVLIGGFSFYLRTLATEDRAVKKKGVNRLSTWAIRDPDIWHREQVKKWGHYVPHYPVLQ